MLLRWGRCYDSAIVIITNFLYMTWWFIVAWTTSESLEIFCCSTVIWKEDAEFCTYVLWFILVDHWDSRLVLIPWLIVISSSCVRSVIVPFDIFNFVTLPFCKQNWIYLLSCSVINCKEDSWTWDCLDLVHYLSHCIDRKFQKEKIALGRRIKFIFKMDRGKQWKGSGRWMLLTLSLFGFLLQGT